jgi:hypothetical protein
MHDLDSPGGADALVRPAARQRGFAAWADVGVRPSEAIPQSLRIVRRAHRDKLGAVTLDLFGEKVDVAARREANDAELVGESVDDVERAAPDGTGAAEDGDRAQGQPCMIFSVRN